MITALGLTIKLIERRDDLRRIAGEKYAKEVAPFRSFLRRMAKAKKQTLAEVALEVGKKMDAAGHNPSWLFAAFVDESEANGGNLP